MFTRVHRNSRIKRVAMQYRILFFLILQMTVEGTRRCTIPDYFRGDWYSSESGHDVFTQITADKWDSNWDVEVLSCEDLFTHPNPVPHQDRNNITMFMVSSGGLGRCYFCVDFLWRTENILQYRKGNCIPAQVGHAVSLNISCNAVNPLYGLPSDEDTVTMFRMVPQIVNCETTFKGLYQFSYEMDIGGGGICNSPDNQIKACQDPGSQYIDNEVFYMTYSRCPDVAASKNQTIRYHCMGSWEAKQRGIVYTFAAIADDEEMDLREKFKCLMTMNPQKGDKKRWLMSRFTSCKHLNGIFNGPVKLVLTGIAPSNEKTISHCNLPKEIAGNWVTGGTGNQLDVIVNETNIHFLSDPNAVDSIEANYACQKRSGTRYLMSLAVVVNVKRNMCVWKSYHKITKQLCIEKVSQETFRLTYSGVVWILPACLQNPVIGSVARVMKF